jgi:peptide/nickel transport system permease protein
MDFLSSRKKRKDQELDVMVSMSRSRSQWSDIIGRLLRNKLGVVGLAIVIFLLVSTIFAGLISPYDYTKQNLLIAFTYPGREHIMGTDNYGRDLWTRLLYGGRISLLIAFISAVVSTVAGMVLGAITGYFGGKLDLIVTRVLDVIMAIPGLLLAIAISSALGSGPFNTVLAISISGIPGGTRIMRSTVMSIKSNEFVEAAIATGSSNLRAVFKHILPNTIAPLLLNSTLAISGGVMAVSALSFVGLGVNPPTPEWGSILNAGRPYIRDFWPLIVFPALFVSLTTFGFNLLGDAMRDALDPRLKD